MAIGNPKKVMRARTVGKSLATKIAATGRMATMRKGAIGRTIKNKFAPADNRLGLFVFSKRKVVWAWHTKI